jgi:hypothetical protein
VALLSGETGVATMRFLLSLLIPNVGYATEKPYDVDCVQRVPFFSFFLNGDTTSFDAIRCFPGGSRKPARNAPDQCEDPYSVILNPWEASVLDDPCMLYAPKSTKVSVKKYYDTLLILL